MSSSSVSSRMSSLSSLLVSALVFVLTLSSSSSPVSAFSGYSVSQQTAKGQLTTAYAGTAVRQYPLGPFLSISQVGLTPDKVYAAEWQIPITFPNIPALGKPFVFNFFGVNYTSITVTSKGFMYMGSYGYSDIDNLDTAGGAPDYSSGGSGFPAIAGEQRPVLSFMHSAGGAIAATQLANSGSTAGGTCMLGGAACQFNMYYYEIMPPISSYVSSTLSTNGQKIMTTVTLTPLNSIGTTADGYRFILVGLQLRDISGVTAQVIVILYQSGLIEIFYYTMTNSGGTSGDYNSAHNGVGFVSAGIQGVVGQTTKHFSLDSPDINQVDYPTFQAALSSTAISFKPLE